MFEHFATRSLLRSHMQYATMNLLIGNITEVLVYGFVSLPYFNDKNDFFPVLQEIICEVYLIDASVVTLI